MRKEEGRVGFKHRHGLPKKCHYHCYHLNPKIVKDFVVELVPPHIQSVQDLRGKRVQIVGLVLYRNYLKKKKKKIFFIIIS